MSAPKKTKVAILGGGVAAVSAAFGLTGSEALCDRYDVTIYQMGFRLGGKGASGRNAKACNRIEEHGLHMWMGFYENAFRIMRACYDELGRGPNDAIPTWQDAFHPQSYIVLYEQLAQAGLPDDGWVPWSFNFPFDPKRTPGDGGEPPGVWSHLHMMVDWLFRRWEAAAHVHRRKQAAGRDGDGFIPCWMQEIVKAAEFEAARSFMSLERRVGVVAHRPHSVWEAADDLSAMLHLSSARALLQSLSPDPRQHPDHAHSVLASLIASFMKASWRYLAGEVDTDLEARKLWIETALVGASIVGFLNDGVARTGWDAVDDLDLRAWLRKHGANDIALQSAPVRGIYDLVFGFVGGAIKEGRLAAGTAMRGLLRMVFTYQGAIFYKMQAGMGDIVFAPFYEVLKRRGVKFEFFHRVTELKLTDDKARIAAIDFVKQVKLKGDGEKEPYAPLVQVKGLPCWPSEPLYDQIEGGDALERSGVNLESAWSPKWQDETPLTLKLGVDFDQVVLAISVAGLPAICPALVEANPRFGAMLHGLETVQTLGVQLWMTPDLAGLGWKTPAGITEAPVMTSYVEPIDTWGDFTHVLEREDWPAGAAPKSIAYLCGPLTDADTIPPYTDAGFPAREKDRLGEIVKGYLERDARRIWPSTTTTDAAAGFDWSKLVDAADGKGAARLAGQYVRVNVDPTERYVLSVPGSTKLRLKTDESGFSNLFLAGDWIENGLNASCVEAAATAGLLASRAISGFPTDIVGEHIEEKCPI